MEISQRVHTERVERRRLVVTVCLELLALVLLGILEIVLRTTSLFPVRSVTFNLSEMAINFTRNNGMSSMNKFAFNADVSYSVVVALSFCIPSCLILTCELIRSKLVEEDNPVRVATLCVICNIHSFGRRVARFLGTFLAGLLMTMIFVDVTKVMVGRLRPIFLEICEVNTTQCSTGFASNPTQCFNGTHCLNDFNSTRCFNGTQCSNGFNSTQCVNGTQCSTGFNSTQCVNGTQCSNGFNSTQCVNGTQCSNDFNSAQCVNGTQCSTGFNSTQCVNGTQCSNGFNSTQCVNGTQCSNDFNSAKCVNGTQCSTGFNSTQCVNGTQCSNGFNSTQCVNGTQCSNDFNSAKCVNGTQCSNGSYSMQCVNTTQCYCGSGVTLCSDNIASSSLCEIPFCTQSDVSLLRWTRLSFPSFHAATTSFAAVFMAIYGESMITRGLRCHVFGPFITSCGVMASLLCGLSRYALYYSHWTDVAVGFAVGTIIAVYICVFVLDDFMEFNELRSQRLYRKLSSIQALNNGARSDNDKGNASKLPWYWTAWNWNMMENMRHEEILMESRRHDDVISLDSRTRNAASRDQLLDSYPYTYY